MALGTFLLTSKLAKYTFLHKFLNLQTTQCMKVKLVSHVYSSILYMHIYTNGVCIQAVVSIVSVRQLYSALRILLGKWACILRKSLRLVQGCQPYRFTGILPIIEMLLPPTVFTRVSPAISCSRRRPRWRAYVNTPLLDELMTSLL